MKFVDEADIEVRGGNGGAGCVSFLREKYRPKGGPDGGNGGDGGSVVLSVDTGLSTLLDFKFQPRIAADNGAPGRGKQQAGKSGDDRVVRVPLGTVARDLESGEIIADLDTRGGRCRHRPGRAGRTRQLQLRDVHPPGAALCAAGNPRRGAPHPPRAAAHGGCRPGRLPQRRQVDPDPARLGRPPARGGLPLHHAGTQPRGGSFRRGEELRPRRHSGPHRGSSRRARSRRSLPAPRLPHERAHPPGRRRRPQRPRPARRLRRDQPRAAPLRRRAGFEAADRRSQQDRSGRLAGSAGTSCASASESAGSTCG